MCKHLTPSLPQPVNFPAEKCMDAPANSILSGLITSTSNAIPVDKSPFTRQCEKEDRKAKEFQILRFDWSFPSDIVAVKGLRPVRVTHSVYPSLLLL